MLVWTVSRVSHNGHSSSAGGGGRVDKKCIISRRPQRQYLCAETAHMSCDVSWNLGVVVASHDTSVSVFSIERNERFVSFRVDTEEQLAPWLPVHDLLEPCSEAYIHRICLCDDGYILLALAILPVPLPSNRLHADGAQMQNALAVYSVRGQFVQRSCHPNETKVSPDRRTVIVKSPVTFLSVPGRGNVGISGHENGSVMFFDVRNLELLHEFRPHDRSLTCIFSSTPHSGSNSTERGGVVVPAPETSAVISAKLGPRQDMPAVLCITTASGGFYVCALPDFIRWDRVRSQSTLAQLVHAPMAVVRGSLQQAQNFTLLASDGAGQLAQNAKSYADDALAKVAHVLC